jgi:hypothetical protein
MRPLQLAADMPRSSYRGAGRIERFRGIPAPADLLVPYAAGPGALRGESTAIRCLPAAAVAKPRSRCR